MPATREITVRDLLTHTSGLESGGAGASAGARIAPRQRHRQSRGVRAEARRGAARLPAGHAWRYSALAGIETLGRIVEVASGLTFDQFLKQRMFEPLGMKDTAFYPADGPHRRAWSRCTTTATGSSVRIETRVAGDEDAVLGRRRALVDRGRLHAVRADARQRRRVERQAHPGPRTVDLMASNHVGDLSTAGAAPAAEGHGLRPDAWTWCSTPSAPAFALERHVRLGRRVRHVLLGGSEGRSGRRADGADAGGTLRADFQNAVMQAIVD